MSFYTHPNTKLSVFYISFMREIENSRGPEEIWEEGKRKVQIFVK
jgi:hypothetical protein